MSSKENSTLYEYARTRKFSKIAKRTKKYPKEAQYHKRSLTALHWLANICPSVDIVRVVFEAYPPAIMIVSDFGNTPLDLAIHNERPMEIILLLIELERDLRKTIKDQLPPTSTKKLMQQQLSNKVKKNRVPDHHLAAKISTLNQNNSSLFQLVTKLTSTCQDLRTEKDYLEKNLQRHVGSGDGVVEIPPMEIVSSVAASITTEDEHSQAHKKLLKKRQQKIDETKNQEMENNDNADDSHLNAVPQSQAEIDLDYKMALEKMVQDLVSEKSALTKNIAIVEKTIKTQKKKPNSSVGIVPS